MTTTEPMTREPMTRQELLELAGLDAFGLLDEYEAALYTRSFHHAPVAVQDEIITLQAALVSDESLLPDDVPPAELRGKVVSAVNGAIERGDGELAPLASIGTGRVLEARHAATMHAAGSNRLRLTMSGQFWRAAAFVLAATTFAALYFGVYEHRENNRIIELWISSQTEDDVVDAMGDSFFKMFVSDRNNTRITLVPKDGEGRFHCMVYANTNSAGGSTTCAVGLKTEHLAQGQKFTLIARDREGVEHTHHTFTSRGVINGVRLNDIETRLVASLSWELLDATGSVVASSA